MKVKKFVPVSVHEACDRFPLAGVVALLGGMDPFSILRFQWRGQSKPASAAKSLQRSAREAGYRVRVATHDKVITVIYEGKIK